MLQKASTVGKADSLFMKTTCNVKGDKQSKGAVAIRHQRVVEHFCVSNRDPEAGDQIEPNDMKPTEFLLFAGYNNSLKAIVGEDKKFQTTFEYPKPTKAYDIGDGQFQ